MSGRGDAAPGRATRHEAPQAAQFSGGAGLDYMAQYGIRADTFGRISVEVRLHPARNPLAVFRQTLTLEEVMASPPVFGPLTRFQCCPSPPSREE
ncbi:hypothetical protein [Sphaerotilus microaerophilus]|uniref:Uncharacterized protein n=1 Tax=Sphaerotilus microaerophilus TaxID=2914710 RepID=A0ABN6PLS2_9BURK|nr:hypothetical protein [Sphaerotilus sp. FB-5]BDI05162.1 hypothetical protein CATMQ487_21320 [Sphaerotilus sp. FB-5]